jgi:isopenicillin N synthase-like dioxygenase
VSSFGTFASYRAFAGALLDSLQAKGKTADWREQLDLSTVDVPRKPGDPTYRNLFSYNQWPSRSGLPRFQSVYEDFAGQMSGVFSEIVKLVADAVRLGEAPG